MNIAGTWELTQSIDRQTFPVRFGRDGRVSVEVRGMTFFGAWMQSGPAGQISFAVTDSAGRSLTVYHGSVNGDEMSGTQRGLGAQPGGPVFDGTWSARLIVE